MYPPISPPAPSTRIFAVCVVIGALAANIWAHRFGRTRSELEKQALHQLRLAQRLDPYGDTLL